MSEEEKVVEEVQTEVEEQQWDKVKQEKDQYKANFERVAAERDAIREEMKSYNDKIEALERAIKQKEETDSIPKLDPLTADVPDILRLNDALSNQLKEATVRLSNLEDKAKQYETQREKELSEQRKQSVIEKILKPLDEEFGAKYRNEAKRLADQWVDTGKEKQPEDALDASILMRKAYKSVIETPKTKKAIPTDSGAGGVHIDDTKPKTGSLKDVLADLKKNPGIWRSGTD